MTKPERTIHFFSSSVRAQDRAVQRQDHRQHASFTKEPWNKIQKTWEIVFFFVCKSVPALEAFFICDFLEGIHNPSDVTSCVDRCTKTYWGRRVKIRLFSLFEKFKFYWQTNKPILVYLPGEVNKLGGAVYSSLFPNRPTHAGL